MIKKHLWENGKIIREMVMVLLIKRMVKNMKDIGKMI
jgi:hypothetical protein